MEEKHIKMYFFLYKFMSSEIDQLTILIDENVIENKLSIFTEIENK